MNVVTVSLNPALDQTVCIDNFAVNVVNRGRGMRFEAGGKGVNVALFLADYYRQKGLPGNITVTGLLGRANASIFEDLFAQRDLRDRFVRIPGRTRVGVKIVDEANQQTTDINMPGLSPSEEAQELVFNTVAGLVQTHDWFVLTGSLPPGVPPETYARLTRMIHERGGRVALDSSGPALRDGLLAAPELVKPNIAELEEQAGTRLVGLEAVRDAVRQILARGTRLVAVSMGKQGALFVTPERSVRAAVPQVSVKSTVGAGDAMLAGALLGFEQRLDLAELARLSAAFSVMVVTQTQRGLPDLAALESLSEQITIEELA